MHALTCTYMRASTPVHAHMHTHPCVFAHAWEIADWGSDCPEAQILVEGVRVPGSGEAGTLGVPGWQEEL
jgi:hypothetical protein